MEQKIPEEIIKNHEFAMIKESRPRLKGSDWKFFNKGKSGIEVSELFPEVGNVIDDITVIRSVYSDTFNHDPAVMFMNTGSVRFGRPSLGSWLSYGIGSENKDLPAFIVLASGKNRQPLLDSYWGSGFLPAEHQGIQFRTKGDPVLFVDNPEGVSRVQRRRQLDLINWMNAKRFESVGDPEISARISQYEMAFKMQMSVPELTDISTEPESIRNLYGSEPGKCHLQIIVYWQGDLPKEVYDSFNFMTRVGTLMVRLLAIIPSGVDPSISQLLLFLRISNKEECLKKHLSCGVVNLEERQCLKGQEKAMEEIITLMVLVCGWLEVVSERPCAWCY